LKRVLLLSGLSGAGKTTLALALQDYLGPLLVAIVDGDLMRKKASGLGFSKKDRFENLHRMAIEALQSESEICIVASIAPFNDARAHFFRIVEEKKTAALIYINTPLKVCESRDPKGLYEKARCGEIEQFTGISDPYEIPPYPNLVIDTTTLSIKECIDKILLELFSKPVEEK